LEQLIVIGVAIAFTAIIFFFASSYSADSLRVAQAQDSVDRLAAAADYVYSLGPNSKDYVTVYLPEDLSHINVSGDRILFRLVSQNGVTDVFAHSKSELIGSLPSGRGKQKILVQYLSNGKVVIGEAGVTCTPDYFTHTSEPGDSFSDEVEVLNNADFEVSGINVSLSGTISSLASISAFPSTLMPGNSSSVSIQYDIPPDQQTGVFGGYLLVDTQNDGSCLTQLTVRVQGQSSCPALCSGQGYAGGTCRASPSDCVLNSEDYAPLNDDACDDPTPSCCCGPTQDLLGPAVSWLNVTPSEPTTADNITINGLCNDTDRGSSYIASAEGRIDGGPLTAFSANDGAYLSSVTETVSHTFPSLAPGQHIAEMRCTDSANNTGDFRYIYFNVSMGDVVGPIVTYMVRSDLAPTTFVNLTEFGSVTEIYTGNHDIASCQGKVDGGDWVAATPSDGSFDSATEDFEFPVGQLDAGMHTVYSRCTDSLGNVGGIYNDSFGVSDSDVMLIIDVSGSMADPVTNAVDNNEMYTSNSAFTLLKSVTVDGKNGDEANVTVRARSNTAGCAASYEVRIGGNVVASGVRNSTSYATVVYNISVAAYEPPFTVDLYMQKIFSGACRAYNSNFGLTQLPTKMAAAQSAASSFVDIVDNSSQLGLVSYGTTATTVRTLRSMASSSNKVDIKNAINALVPTSSTCIECGINNAVAELTSARARYPAAVRVAILLTDGQGNVGNSLNGATQARHNNVTIYSIGFGSDVNTDELYNIALLTNGRYYFAPDEETLHYIYQHIGE
jgi:hypothetical protein